MLKKSWYSVSIISLFLLTFALGFARFDGYHDKFFCSQIPTSTNFLGDCLNGIKVNALKHPLVASYIAIGEEHS